MCVIIVTNPKHPISKNELRKAWVLNSDGAGFAYLNHKIIRFKRGFNDFETYWNAIKDLQKKHELLLHLRITSRGNTDKVSTHPFKVGDLLKLEGFSRKPVVAMNGTIHSQSLDKKNGVLLNDTASYIKDHEDAFEVLNQGVIDIIADATGCKWASATLDGIIYSSNFVKHDGRAYSNLYHLYLYSDPYDYKEPYTTYNAGKKKSFTKELTIKHFLKPKLLKQVKKDKKLYKDTKDYVYKHCNFFDCRYCINCIADAETKAELKRVLKDNEDIDFFIFQDIEP